VSQIRVKAMVLAAGLGTRLRPLTDQRPKALVEIGGRTLLEITLERLRGFGVREVIVNVHHFADLVIEHIEARDRFGMRVEISREDVLLDTGGGLRKAAWFFLEDEAGLDEPFILHNVDVVSSIDLERMRQFHLEQNALATLAVLDRPSARPLLFDAEGRLAGHRGSDGRRRVVRDAARLDALEFTGIHVLSPRLLPLLDSVAGADPERPFPIVPAYLDLAAAGHRILAFRADAWPWCDVGSPESLTRARLESNPGRVRDVRERGC
jgi:NDP-sugar pyrophosphorylase family protein